MCDSSFEEDLDRYRRNNVELAVALNDMKADLNTMQMELLQRNRELQRAHAENATLKLEIAQKNQQLSTWRALIIDLVQTNTSKYSEVMKKIGLVPSGAGTAAAVNRPNQNPPPIPKPVPTPATSKPIDQNALANIVQRRQKEKEVGDFSLALSDLAEESVTSQLNESRSLESTPVKSSNAVNHVVSRRRASVPPVTPPSTPPLALRQCADRMISNGQTNGKKPSAKAKKMDKIIDENTPINNVAASGRPSRKTAPKNLSEPKLGTKLRRN